MKLSNILKNRNFANASWIIAMNLFRSLLAVIITMLTTRYLGPSNYGLIGYAQSVVAFVAPIALLGLSNVIVQEYVDSPEAEGETLGTALLMSLISSVICIFGVFAFSSFININEKVTIVVCTLYSTVLVTQNVILIDYWFQAKLISKYSSISSCIAYFLVAIYKVYLLATGKNVFWFAISNSLDYLLLAFILYIVYKRFGGQKLSFSYRKAKKMFAKSKYYILTNMMIAVFAQTDKIMLKLMIGEEATGYYSAAVYCAGIMIFVYTAIIDSVRPTIFKSKHISYMMFEKRISQLYSIIIYLSLIQSLIFTVFAPLIINILCGSEFIQSIPILRLVVWYITFSEIGSIRNIWILSENKQKWLWVINLSGAIANVILNYILIPHWGAIGAAFASLFTHFFANVVISYIIKPIRKNTYIMIRGLSLGTVKSIINDLS